MVDRESAELIFFVLRQFCNVKVLSSWRRSIAVGSVTGLPEPSGFAQIWVAVDRLAKMAHFVPTRTGDKSPARVLADLGWDRGSICISSFWKEFMEHLGVLLYGFPSRRERSKLNITQGTCTCKGALLRDRRSTQQGATPRTIDQHATIVLVSSTVACRSTQHHSTLLCARQMGV